MPEYHIGQLAGYKRFTTLEFQYMNKKYIFQWFPKINSLQNYEKTILYRKQKDYPYSVFGGLAWSNRKSSKW